VHRYLWRGQALYIRSLFEANRNVTDPRQQRVRTSHYLQHPNPGIPIADTDDHRHCSGRRRSCSRSGSTRTHTPTRLPLEVWRILIHGFVGLILTMAIGSKYERNLPVHNLDRLFPYPRDDLAAANVGYSSPTIEVLETRLWARWTLYIDRRRSMNTILVAYHSTDPLDASHHFRSNRTAQYIASDLEHRTQVIWQRRVKGDRPSEEELHRQYQASLTTSLAHDDENHAAQSAGEYCHGIRKEENITKQARWDRCVNLKKRYPHS
jgi:hypothetical protein